MTQNGFGKSKHRERHDTKGVGIFVSEGGINPKQRRAGSIIRQIFSAAASLLVFSLSISITLTNKEERKKQIQPELQLTC